MQPRARKTAPLAAMVAAAAGCAQGSSAEPSTGFSHGVGVSSGTATAVTGASGTQAGATVASGTASSGTASSGTASSGAVSSGTPSTGSATGTTGPGCAGAPFRVDVPNTWLEDAVVTEDRIVLVGYEEGQGGRLLALDPCDGTQVDERTLQFDGQTGTKLFAVRRLGADLIVAGSSPTASDPRQGLFARILPQTLQSVWEVPLHGSSAEDETVALDVAAGGRVFLGGASDLLNPKPWLITADDGGQACGFGAMLSPDLTGDVRAVAYKEDGSEVYAAANMSDGAAYLLRYAADCACPCSPLASPKLSLPITGSETVVTALAPAGSQVLAAGVVRKMGGSNDLVGFVAALSPQSGVVSAAWTVDPTLLGDGWLDLRVASGRLYVAGGEDWDGISPTFVGAKAWGAALDLPLTNQSAPVWEVQPPNLDAFLGVAHDPARDAVVFAGNEAGEGVVVVCTADGACP